MVINNRFHFGVGASAMPAVVRVLEADDFPTATAPAIAGVCADSEPAVIAVAVGVLGDETIDGFAGVVDDKDGGGHCLGKKLSGQETPVWGVYALIRKNTGWLT